MNKGINASNNRWSGSLIKRDFLHGPDQQDSLSEALSIRYQGLHYECATKAYHWGEHRQHNLEFLFIKDGNYVGEINGRELTLGNGNVLIVDQGDLHSDQCFPPLAYYAIWFEIQQIANGAPINLLRANLSADKHVHALGDCVILETLDRLFCEEQRDNRFALPLQQALAYEVFWRLVNDLPDDILNPLLIKRTRQSELRERLMRLFEENRNTPITVKDMAKDLKMSESALAHTCTETLGISPAKAFSRFRQEKARQLLQHSSLSVKEIASELGFHDESHFIHAFRKEHGTTPGGFRDSPTSNK